MSRLSRYLIMQFLRDALALYCVALLLVWLTQMLRLFDLITLKGQGLLTLAGQAFLTTPPLAREIIYICMAIGLARAFKTLQKSHELHTIHVSKRLSAVWAALAIFCLGGVSIALFLAHWAEPVSRHKTAEWSAQIVAELVGQVVTPGRFTEIADGVVLHIGGRLPDGTITEFFADDNRENSIRQTYFAETAIIVATDEGYQISLRNGRLETVDAGDSYSEIQFSRYELALDNLTHIVQVGFPQADRDTFDLVRMGLAGAGLTRSMVIEINKRNAEGLRVISICLLVAALLAFPHARRGRDWVPIEIGILIVAFAERALSSATTIGDGLGHYLGPILMLVAALIVLSSRSVNRARSRHRAAPV